METEVILREKASPSAALDTAHEETRAGTSRTTHPRKGCYTRV